MNYSFFFIFSYFDCSRSEDIFSAHFFSSVLKIVYIIFIAYIGLLAQAYVQE